MNTETDVALTKLTCKRCGHEWWPRSPGKPIKCPKCQTMRWDKDNDKTPLHLNGD